MLKIRIHHAYDRGIGILPAIENGARKTSLPIAHQQSNARILPRNPGDNVGSTITAVVVHNQDLVFNVERIKRRANAIKECRDILCLAQSWNGQRQLTIESWNAVSPQLRSCLRALRHIGEDS